MKKRILSSVLVAMLVLSITTVTVFAAEWVRIYSGSTEVFWGHNATIAQACVDTAQGMFIASLESDEPIDQSSINWISLLTVVAVMANATTGCEIKCEVYTYTIPGQPIHYMYKYWFVGNNGVEYGPITITPNPYYPSAVENDTVKE